MLTASWDEPENINTKKKEGIDYKCKKETSLYTLAS